MITFATTRRRAAGFTIVEMLVATAVLALMMSILFTLFAQGSRAWQAGERLADINQGNRTALELIAREVSQAMVDTNLISSSQPVFPGLAVYIQSPGKGDAPRHAFKAPGCSSPYDELYFVAPTEVANEMTNDFRMAGYRLACGVHYYCDMPRGKAAKKQQQLPNLIREVFRANYKGAQFSIYDTTWWTGTPGDVKRMANIVAENVLNFEVRAALKTQASYVNLGMRKDRPGGNPRIPPIGPWKNYTDPIGVVVSIAVLDRRLASRINEVGEDWDKTLVNLVYAVTNAVSICLNNYCKP